MIMPLTARISKQTRTTKFRRILLFVIAVVTIYSLGNGKAFYSIKDTYYSDTNTQILSFGSEQDDVLCLINTNYTVPCLQQGKEVWMPFTFLKEYFEIYGSFAPSPDNSKTFKVDHSTGFVKPPVKNYSATGVHADDVNYYVEGRHLVIFIDGREGVPICRQWFPEGFLFSVNIAQYGLSHYSQHVIEISRTVENIDLEGSSLTSWSSANPEASVSQYEENGYKCLYFKTPESLDRNGLVMTFNEDQIGKFNEHRMYSLSSYLKFTKDSSITVILTRALHREKYTIHYVFNTTRLIVNPRVFTIGLGERQEWNRLSRNLYTDLETCIRHRDGKISTTINSSMRSIYSIDSLVIRGEGCVHNLTLASSAHMEQFFDAADWLLKNQDEKGGWATPVKRVLGTSTLQPGWYSALGQGLGISMMARAYWVTKDTRYLNSAVDATKLFHIPSEDGGIRAVFLGKYVWYEEYPTVPASFVLNGFITALFGLYDLAMIAPVPYNNDAQKLFDDGIASLKTILPLYDSGYRTLYDLKHLTMHTEPNVCRWDYHNLHVELLMYLSTIDSDPLFTSIIERWNKYRRGWRSPHN